MPREDVVVVVTIGLHTDSLPLNSPALALHLQTAIDQYRRCEHAPEEMVECRSIKIDDDEWVTDPESLSPELGR